MKMMNKVKALCLAGVLMVTSALPAFAADVVTSAKTDAQVVADLGLLQGDGSGVTEAYLSKTTTRLQAAIMFLRLKGLENTAIAFTSSDNFTDASKLNSANQSILAYLKANPSLGWTGTGNGMFDPMSLISGDQYYKVLLEAAGYKQDTDFAFKDVFTYAKGLGLAKISGVGLLRNRNIATATVEGLKLKVKGGTKLLVDSLLEQKVIDQAKASIAKSPSIQLVTDATVGTYLADDSGKTLYMFTKDTANVSNCTAACVDKWPLYYNEKLQVPGELNAADFGTITRADGKMQSTYKGMPLYYYVSDTKAGEIKGQGVGNVWYVINYHSVMTTKTDTLGTFLVDGKGISLYLFTKDTTGVSVCKGACETAWPIFYTSDIQVSGDLKASDFTTIMREDGTKQTAYKGIPLYYYFKDVKAGDVTGQNVGKVWYVIDVSGAAIMK
jgi:predicted lipoprotein with Yx(FWY)xxD motif